MAELLGETMDDYPRLPERVICAWCKAELFVIQSGWVDADGFFNCGRDRPHRPLTMAEAVR